MTNKAVKEDVRNQLRSEWRDHKSLALMKSLRPLELDAHNTMVEIFSMGEYLGYLGAIYGLALESNLAILAQQHEFLSLKHTLTTISFHHNMVDYMKLPLAASRVKTFSFNCEVEGFFCGYILKLMPVRGNAGEFTTVDMDVFGEVGLTTAKMLSVQRRQQIYRGQISSR